MYYNTLHQLRTTQVVKKMNSNTYWNSKGKHQVVADALQELIPDSGSVKNTIKNKQLERFRKAVNAYYDLYNNGLYNRKSSFSRIFGVAAGDYEYRRGEFSPRLYELAEEKMNEIIELAAAEQNIPVN
jgi:hypothetical protein